MSDKNHRNQQTNNKTLDTQLVLPLNYLSIFWRSFDLFLINCEIELDLSWSKIFLISAVSRTAAVAANPPNLARAGAEITSALFYVFSTKRYALVVTLSINDNIKFLEISSSKYRSEVTKQPKKDMC